MKSEKLSYQSPGHRRPALLALQNLKMARSAHAYVRGNTLQFYAWLRAISAPSHAEDATVWISGPHRSRYAWCGTHGES